MLGTGFFSRLINQHTYIVKSNISVEEGRLSLIKTFLIGENADIPIDEIEKKRFYEDVKKNFNRLREIIRYPDETFRILRVEFRIVYSMYKVLIVDDRISLEQFSALRIEYKSELQESYTLFSILGFFDSDTQKVFLDKENFLENFKQYLDYRRALQSEIHSLGKTAYDFFSGYISICFLRNIPIYQAKKFLNLITDSQIVFSELFKMYFLQLTETQQHSLFQGPLDFVRFIFIRICQDSESLQSFIDQIEYSLQEVSINPSLEQFSLEIIILHLLGVEKSIVEQCIFKLKTEYNHEITKSGQAFLLESAISHFSLFKRISVGIQTCFFTFDLRSTSDREVVLFLLKYMNSGEMNADLLLKTVEKFAWSGTGRFEYPKRLTKGWVSNLEIIGNIDHSLSFFQLAIQIFTTGNSFFSEAFQLSAACYLLEVHILEAQFVKAQSNEHNLLLCRVTPTQQNALRKLTPELYPIFLYVVNQVKNEFMMAASDNFLGQGHYTPDEKIVRKIDQIINDLIEGKNAHEVEARFCLNIEDKLILSSLSPEDTKYLLNFRQKKGNESYVGSEMQELVVKEATRLINIKNLEFTGFTASLGNLKI